MSARSVRTGSFQSSCTSRTFGLAATTASTSRAMSRTFCVSGPTMRNWTGKPTGGPSSRRVTRTHTFGNCSLTLAIRRERTRSRASRPFVITTKTAQLGIEREIEARLSGTGVGRVELDVLVLREQRLHLLDLLGGRGERSAFLQSQLDDELGPVAVREELLRHQPASCDGQCEGRDGRADHPPAALDRSV